jgi:site-specific recombinase XerD
LWLKDYQHLALGSIEVCRHSIRLFFIWLGPQATRKGLTRLTAQQIETFFLTQTKSMGQSARRSLQAALRTFFRFCLQKKFIAQPLDKAVPTIRVYKLATVPRAISEKDAKRLLESIDQSTRVGKRDYAIITLLYTFGVRGGQVAALRLTDIDWAKAQLLFRATKHGKDTLLPLSESRCLGRKENHHVKIL